MEGRLLESIKKHVQGSFYQLLTAIKKNRSLSMLVVINLLLRIPRVPGVIGDDAFLVLWMGRIVQAGDFSSWTVTPLSIIGMYPFSVYPIGVPLLLAFMFWLGLSIESAVLVLSLSFCMIGILGAFDLGKEVFPETKAALLFATVYSLSNLFMRFTYFTISPRGPFLAILPWFLWASVKFVRKRRSHDGVVAGGLLLALFLTHGLALFLVMLYLGVLVGYLCIVAIGNLLRTRTGGMRQWLSLFISKHDMIVAITAHASSFRKLKRPVIWTVFMAAILSAYLIGLTVLNIDPGKTVPFLLPNDTILGVTINLIVDYGLRLGALSWFFPLGIVASFHNDYYTNRRWLHFVLVPVVAFTIPLSLYASVVFLPVMVYYSVYGFETAWKNWISNLILLSLLAFVVVYGAMYHTYVANLTLLASGLIILVGLALVGLLGLELASRLYKMGNTLTANNAWGFIILIIISFSIVTMDGLIQQNDSSYITEDERAVAAFFPALSETGIVFVYDHVVARRLQAYGIPAIRSFNEQIGLHLGWITPDQIIEDTPVEFKLDLFLLHGDILFYKGAYPEKVVWNKLYGLDLTISANYSMAIEYNLEFVLVEKTEYGYSDRCEGQYCPLLSSAPIACELVFEGRSMALFRLFSY